MDRDHLVALAAELRAAGCFESAAAHYRLRLALLVPAFFALWFGLLVSSGAVYVGLVLATGLVSVQLGLIGHDAGHRAVDSRAWVNELCGHFGMSIVNGLGFGYWRGQHNLHHKHSQIEDRDPDMQDSLIVTVYARSVARKRGFARWLLRWQAVYFWPVAATFHPYALRLASLRNLLRRRRNARNDRWTLLLHVVLWLAVPALIVGPGAALVTYALVSLVVGGLLTMLFATNHVGMPSLEVGHDLDFFKRQVETSRNLDVPRPLTFLFGGLDHQIEHHLFPNMGAPGLRAARRVVEPFCRARGLRYTAVGFMAAQRAVLAHLSTVGQSAEA